jgi:Glycosyl hydrolases family 38 N-terminal domain
VYIDRIREVELGRTTGLTRVGRGEEEGSKRWVARPDDPELARAELLAGTSGTDVASGQVRMRAGGLPLLRRMGDGTRRQAVRAVIDWPHEPATVTMTLRCDGAVDDQQEVALASGRNRVRLFARDEGRTRSASIDIHDQSSELLRADFALEPAREWTVYLIHHSHLDIGYTDAQATVLRNQRAYLDQVLDLATATSDWPDDAQFRWNMEAYWPLQEWIRLRPPPVVSAFFDLVRAGRVEISALPFNFHSEACSIDELAHSFRFVDDLRRAHDIEISTAMQTDVPGATIGLAQLLVDAGVRFLSVSHNYAGRSVPHHVGGQNLTRPFWWETPAGDRLMAWFGDTPHGMAYMEGTMLGLSDGYEQTLTLLPEYLAALAARPYPYEGALSEWWRVPSGKLLTKQAYPHDILHLRVLGAYSDNAGPSIVPAQVAREWNQVWEYPRLRMATNADFYRAARDRIGDRIDTFHGDWTDWWADGLGSAARFVSMGRRTQTAIRTAQSLHAIAGSQGAADGDETSAGVTAVYADLSLFDEHTWGAADPWEDTADSWWSGSRQWQTKSGYAVQAADRAGELVESGLERLVSRISSLHGDEPVVVVVNPTMQVRTDLVHSFVPASRFGPAIELTDMERGTKVPCEARELAQKDHDASRPRGSDLSFIAADVPPFGYRAYRLTDRSGTTASPLDRADSDTVLRNDAFELRFDLAEGCIASLIDRRTGAELVADDSIFGFGQYVYDRFATAPRFNHFSSKIESRRLELLGERAVAQHAALIERSSTELWDRLTVRFAAPGTSWLELTMTLPAGIDRLDLEYRLSKPDEEGKESGYLAFPFNVAPDGLRAEITGGIYTADAPHIPGAAQHMRAIRHWIRIPDTDRSICWASLDAPLVQFGNIHLPYAPFPATLRQEPQDQTTIYSWLFNNVWDTNFPSSQAGEISYRYSICLADLGAGDRPARSLAASITSPLLTSVRGGMLPGAAATGSFCVPEGDPEVLALRPSRGDGDLSVLIQSSAPEPGSVTLRFPGLVVHRAWVGDHLDHAVEPAEVRDGVVLAALRPGSLSTVLLETGNGER